MSNRKNAHSPAFRSPQIEVLEPRVVLTAGQLDPGFGMSGLVQSDLFGTFEQLTDVALQRDGKIVAVGERLGDLNTRTILARYNDDGSLDSSFGTDGRVSIDLTSNPDGARAVAIQQDGKILVAGTGQRLLFNSDVFVARFLPNGTLDTGFANAGIRWLEVGGQELATDLQITSSGQILVSANYSGTLLGGGGLIARLNANGNVDTSFGLLGFVLESGASFEDLEIGPAGQLVVAGAESAGVVISRYQPNGGIDFTFGPTGAIVIPNAESPALEVQEDGKTVVGYAEVLAGGRRRASVTRLEFNGSLDVGFGSGGRTVVDFAAALPGVNVSQISARPVELAFSPNGRIVLFTKTSTPTMDYLGAARLLSTGALDSTFSGSIATVGTFPNASAGLVASDGDVVVAGSTTQNENFLIARFDGGPLLPGLEISNVAGTVRITNGPADSRFSVEDRGSLGVRISIPGVVETVTYLDATDVEIDTEAGIDAVSYLYVSNGLAPARNATVNLGDGNDTFQFVAADFATFDGISPVTFDFFGNDDNDIMVIDWGGISGQLVSDVPVTMNVDGGEGNDQIDLDFVNSTIEDSFAMTLDGAEGGDLIDVDFQQTTVGTPGDFSLQGIAGSGDDTVHLTADDGSLAWTGLFKLDFDLGAGIDSFTGDTIFLAPSAAAVASALDARLKGGNGNDTIVWDFEVRFDSRTGTPAPASYLLSIDSGGNQDSITVDALFDDLNPTPTGTADLGDLTFITRAGAGHDVLDATLVDAGLFGNLTAILDGGMDIDQCNVVGNIQVQNCEN